MHPVKQKGHCGKKNPFTFSKSYNKGSAQRQDVQLLFSKIKILISELMSLIVTTFAIKGSPIINFESTFKYPFSTVLLKVVSATFLLVCFVCLKESTCETRKNVFYFTSKALLFLR